jgi:hypothetical protein
LKLFSGVQGGAKIGLNIFKGVGIHLKPPDLLVIFLEPV